MTSLRVMILFPLLLSSPAFADLVVTSPQNHSTSLRDCGVLLAPGDPVPPESHAGFIRNIIANPADDTARLVYADWLEERSQPDLAEFIRLQVQQVTMSRDRTVSLPQIQANIDRQRELVSQHQHEWIPQRIAGEGWTYVFNRGFIDQIRMPFEARHTDRLRDLFEQIPTLRFVRFSGGLNYDLESGPRPRTRDEDGLISRMIGVFSGPLHLAPGQEHTFETTLPLTGGGFLGTRSARRYLQNTSTSHLALRFRRGPLGEIRIDSGMSLIAHLAIGLYSQEGRLLRVYITDERSGVTIPAEDIPEGYSLRFLGG